MKLLSRTTFPLCHCERLAKFVKRNYHDDRETMQTADMRGAKQSRGYQHYHGIASLPLSLALIHSALIIGDFIWRISKSLAMTSGVVVRNDVGDIMTL